ncbi:MAG: stage III sporulation protein AE [Oscillospiraceae bacterium]|jgi:stage III sporulation protein AE|nr:stage III sporulation protein AE [Oscillospiraceae bacterium]
MKKRLLIIAVLFLLLPIHSLAAEDSSGYPEEFSDMLEEQSSALGADRLPDALPDSADELMHGIDVSDSTAPQNGLAKILDGAKSYIAGAFAGALASCTAIILISIAVGVFKSAFPDAAGKTQGNYAILAAVLAISGIALARVGSFIGLGETVLQELETFGSALLPVVSAAAAASGEVTAAAVKYSASVLVINVMMRAMRGIVMPLIYAYCAVSIADAAVGDGTLSGVADFIRWLCKTILTVFSIVFISYITLSGVVSQTADAMAVKTARVAISTVLPVVGGILSDAASTVLSGAQILKNATGIFGMLAIIAICIVPFLKLGINYLVFKAAGSVSGTVADARISRLINNVSTAFGMTLAMTGVCALMLFVSLVTSVNILA